MDYQPLINRDYRSQPGRSAARPRHHYWLGLVAIPIIIASFLSVAADRNKAAAPERQQTVALNLPAQTLAAPSAATAAVASEPATPAPQAQGSWSTETVRAGDSMARIFSRASLSARTLHDIMSLGGAAKQLTKIHPGDELRLRTDTAQGLLELRYATDKLNEIVVLRQGDDFQVEAVAHEPERRLTHSVGSIDSSLFLAAQKAGLTDNLTMELAGIFGWDVDFVLDIRQGDQFSLLFEELYLDGEFVGHGDILAAEFVNRGKHYQAVRYTDAKGNTDFYSPDGRSMRKAFLRTPVSFSRISSRFSSGRKHPVLNRIRAHKGVDYAAPRGTPIKATGSGKVVLAGTKGGYGKTVVIQHGTRYSTLYAHMSRYARGVRAGKRVQQGQVIGYIGSTGLATGPHLHYEFRLNGVHRNPLTVKLPDAAPIRAEYKADFSAQAQTLMAQLETRKQTAVALNKP